MSVYRIESDPRDLSFLRKPIMRIRERKRVAEARSGRAFGHSVSALVVTVAVLLALLAFTHVVSMRWEQMEQLSAWCYVRHCDWRDRYGRREPFPILQSDLSLPAARDLDIQHRGSMARRSWKESFVVRPGLVQGEFIKLLPNGLGGTWRPSQEDEDATDWMAPVIAD